MADDLADLLPAIMEIARQAGAAIMPFHRTKVASKQFIIKEDNSPVTKADFAANEVIIQRLREFSSWPIVSEESVLADYSERKTWQRYWLVDPLDGTKEFIAGSEFFTVNIALIENGQPVLGVIYVPTEQVCYTAYHGGVAQRHQSGLPAKNLYVQTWDGERHLQIVASRRHDNNDVNQILVEGVACDIARLGSSIKFCKVAEGEADVYPRFGPTSEWDTAAGQCIVEQAGGRVLDQSGQRLRYNTKESMLNPYFIVVGDYDNIELLWR